MKFHLNDKTLGRSSTFEADSHKAALDRVFDECHLSWDGDEGTATLVQILRMATAITYIIQAVYDDNDQVYVLSHVID